MKNILVNGATGQIGIELVETLRKKYGQENVLAVGHQRMPSQDFLSSGPYVQFDTRNYSEFESAVEKHKIDTIYHLASLLSATAEKNPELAWDVNMNGLRNALELARKNSCALFFPSSIGAFGPTTPKEKTPQVTIQRPTTIYGITKLTGELLCDYYHNQFGVDTRGLRFPGLISYKTPPGGGTTDYAVDIFYGALKNGEYTCFLKENTRLDMMYMPDAIEAAIRIMEAEPANLYHRNAYNITAMSFTPKELAEEIKKHIPSFKITYEIDPIRQSIADSWPDSLDDSAARNEWNWRSEHTLSSMTADMLKNLENLLSETR